MIGPVDLEQVLADFRVGGAQWGCDAEDLNLTLICWHRGEGPAEHVDATHDVAMVGIQGSGTVEIGDETHQLHPGEVLLIPKGAVRRIAATSSRFAYLNVHRRRVLRLQARL